MKRCTIVVPDAGPFNSLWVADRLDLLLRLDMRIVVLDAVYDELTSDPDNYPKDYAVKELIDSNQPPFVVELTEKGQSEREKVLRGGKRSRNAGDVAITEFMTADDGLSKYIGPTEPVLVLFEDADIPTVRFIRKPPNLHLLSTVGLLRGLEKVGVIQSAEDVISEMTHPTKPDRITKGRKFVDLPNGIDDPATIGSSWLPYQSQPTVCQKCHKAPCVCTQARGRILGMGA